MDKKAIIKYGLAVILGMGLCYSLIPTKIKIEKVEIEKIVKEKEAAKVIYRDVVKIVKKHADGTIEERTEDKSKETEVSKELTVTDKKTESKVTITQKKLDYLVSVNTKFTPNLNLKPEYMIKLDRRILGNIYIGGFATSDKSFGFGITIGF